MERGRELPRDIAAGDVLLGLASSGVHSNGFSLVRRIVADTGLGWDAPSPFSEGTLGASLLNPTRIYVRPVLDAMRIDGMHGLAHITGGGLTENVPRILPEGLGAQIHLGSWDLPPVFAWLQSSGGMSRDEMLRTFNCGIGLVVVVAPEANAAIRAVLENAGETVHEIGRIEVGEGVCYPGAQ
jgi:phosphoribosylformylglycinamidine cyclo-ligase